MVILGIARDITVRKLTEKQLQESNIRFQHISSSISDISFSCIDNKNGKYMIEWIYGATEKITGYTIQELITMGYWENLVLETDLPVFKEHFLQIPPGSFDTCQFRIQHKDGRMIWIESSVECVRRLDVPHLTYLYGGMVDISARMQYIRELHESEQKFRSLVENAFDGIYLTNGRYFTYANKKFCEITGFTEKELTSGNFDFDILLSENVQIEVRKRTVRRKQGKYVPSLFEFEIITKEGLIKHVEVSTVDVSTESEFLVLGIVRDISERKKVESQMIQSGRLSALGEMAAGIAHEINQPLNTLSLAFDNILMEAQDKPSVNAKYLNSKSQKINDSILRIRNIIDHIRAFSRNQEGYLFSAFNINESIKNAVSLVSEQYRITGIELFVNLEPTVHSIIGNTYRFEQVILNLLSNAKDALMEKKEKLRQSYPMFVRISTIKNDPNTTIEVQDNGIGIPAENIDKTILPFYTTKETGKGTGLGLSISHGIINEMNGTLQIQSKVMEGTTIRITLPEKPEKN
jgi:PAS domain S-box-containing protein